MLRCEPLLTITSISAVVLMTLHLADDIVRGASPADISNLVGIAILVFWLSCAVCLPEGRWRHGLLLLGGAFSVLMPVIHFSGHGMDSVRGSAGGFFSVWLVLALGVAGGLAMVLSVAAWRERRVATAAQPS
jgi:hypothetical protein